MNTFNVNNYISSALDREICPPRLVELIELHVGPGPHPGTESEQVSHAGPVLVRHGRTTAQTVYHDEYEMLLHTLDRIKPIFYMPNPPPRRGSFLEAAHNTLQKADSLREQIETLSYWRHKGTDEEKAVSSLLVTQMAPLMRVDPASFIQQLTPQRMRTASELLQVHGTPSWASQFYTSANEAARWLTRWINPDLLKNISFPLKAFISKGNRFVESGAWYDEETESLHFEDPRGSPYASTVIHELGHAIEDHNLNMGAQARQLQKQMYSGVDPPPFIGLRQQWYPTRLYDQYAAVRYKDGGTEILSTGLEFLADRSLSRLLLMGDLDHFAWTLVALKGKLL